ncbi:tetratricopeptide repeat protein [Magnetococcales bacterium HHB-1]
MIQTPTFILQIQTEKISQCRTDPQITWFWQRPNGKQSAPVVVDAHEWQSVAVAVAGYRQLVKMANPQLAEETLFAVGTELFHLCFQEIWPEIIETVKQKKGLQFFIASDHLELLILPWELVCDQQGIMLVAVTGITIRRLPQATTTIPQRCTITQPPPLRLLLVPSEPKMLSSIPAHQIAAEMAAMAYALDDDLGIEITPVATLSVVREAIQSTGPHLLCFIGPTEIKQGQGFFCFEQENGDIWPISGEEIRRELLHDSGVQAVLFFGRVDQAAAPVAAMAALCRAVTHQEELSLSIAWPDHFGKLQTLKRWQQFLAHLSRYGDLDRALNQARSTALTEDRQQGYPGGTLPLLFAATSQQKIFNASHFAAMMHATGDIMLQRPLPGLDCGGVYHYQPLTLVMSRLLPALKKGQVNFLALTGGAGRGKTALAVSLAQELRSEKFAMIALSGSEANPLTTARIVQAVSRMLFHHNLLEEREALNDESIRIEDRLSLLLAILNQRLPALLILDNLVFDTEEGVHPELQGLLNFFAQHLNGKSRLIVTAEKWPENVSRKMHTHVEDLNQLKIPESTLSQALFSHAAVKRQWKGIEEPVSLWQSLVKQPMHVGLWPLLRGVLALLPPEESLKHLKNLKKSPEAQLTTLLQEDLDSQDIKPLYALVWLELAFSKDLLQEITELSVQDLDAWIEMALDLGLIQPGAEWANTALWHVTPALKLLLRQNTPLQKGEQNALHRRIAQFYLNLIEEDRFNRLGQTREDLLYHAAYHLLVGDDPEQAVDVYASLSQYLLSKGFFHTLGRQNQKLWSLTEHPSVANWLALTYSQTGAPKKAVTWYEKTLEIVKQEKPYQQEKAVALHGLAELDLQNGEAASAIEKLHQVLDIQRSSGNMIGVAATWRQMAAIEQKQDNLQSAQEMLNQGRLVSKQVGDQAGESEALQLLAALDYSRGDVAEALFKYKHALDMDLKSGHRGGQLNALVMIANIHLAQQQWDEAQQNYESCLNLLKHQPDQSTEAFVLHQLGTVEIYQKQFGNAVLRFQRSLEIKHGLRDYSGVSSTFFQLGRLAKEVGRVEEALKLMGVSLRLDQETGNPDAHEGQDVCERMAEALGLHEDALEELLDEAWDAYRKDRGIALIDAAFARPANPIASSAPESVSTGKPFIPIMPINNAKTPG